MISLKVSDVSVSYENQPVLDHVSLTLCKGEIVSLLGKSGVGKTTLFHVIAGLVTADGGIVTVGDPPRPAVSGDVGYMLQKDLLLPFRTVEDNIALPFRIQGMKKREARQMVSRYLKEFGLDGCPKKYPAQLSGGMRQRAALLRTYLFGAPVALLDEPFSALDAFTKNAMHEWFQQIMQEIDMSILFITHDVDEAIALSDRIYILDGVPGQMKAEITINKSRPRNLDFRISDEFLQYKKQILQLIQTEQN